MPGPTVLRMAEVARSQIGTHEGPGENEQKYGAWFGANKQSWCCMFMSWCSAQAGATYLGKPFRFSLCQAARDHAKGNSRWTTTPTVGAICMKAHPLGKGHVGFVVTLLKNGNVQSVEGNTNAQGAREGEGVFLRERPAAAWDGYILLDETGGSASITSSHQEPDKVNPRINPPQTFDSPIVDVRNVATNGVAGCLILCRSGALYAFGVPSIRGANGQAWFVGRRAAALDYVDWPTATDPGKVKITAHTGETYVLPA